MRISPVLAYLLGLFLGSSFPLFPLSYLAGLLSLALVFSWLEKRGFLSRTLGCGLYLLVLVGGIQSYWVSQGNGPPESEGLILNQPVDLHGTIAAPVRYIPEGVVIILDVEEWIGQGPSHPVRERIRIVWRDPDLPLVFGDQIRVKAVLRESAGTQNPGGFNYGHYLRRQGIQAVASVQGPGVIQASLPRSFGFPAMVLGTVDRWRFAIYEAAVASFSNPALGLFLGMVLGEQSFIEPEVRDHFMASGTVHILSISGSHLGFLALSVFSGARWAMRRLPYYWLERVSLHITSTRFAILATLPVVSFYALLAGAETATLRSWIMIVVCGAGVWMGRERKVLAALAVAALVILIPHPEAVYDISFQLSYLSVAAIGLILGREIVAKNEEPVVNPSRPVKTRSWLDLLWGKTRIAWIMSFAVSLTTLPLVALYFHQIPWVGVVANLIVVPLVGFLVIPLGLLCGMAVLVAGGNTIPLTGINQGIFESLALLVKWIAGIPGAQWNVASPSIPSILVFWLILGAVFMLWHHRVVRWSGATILVGIICLWGWSPRTGWVPGMVQVTFLDVGQGDAALLELPDGHTVLIDGGASYPRLDMGRAVIGPFLWNKGIHRLDHVVATHPQWDHVGGLPWVVRTFPVTQIWSNGIKREERFYRDLQAAILQARVQESIPVSGQELVRSGPCSLRVLNSRLSEPRVLVASRPILAGTVLNNRSLITRLDCGNTSFLFTADAEQEALERLAGVREGVTAAVVKVPHHGAKSSLNYNWVGRLSAKALVVSVGSHNRYGHPASEVVGAYEKLGVPFYRTDRDGAISFFMEPGSAQLLVSTAREQNLTPVSFQIGMWRMELANWKRLWNR